MVKKTERVTSTFSKEEKELISLILKLLNEPEACFGRIAILSFIYKNLVFASPTIESLNTQYHLKVKGKLLEDEYSYRNYLYKLKELKGGEDGTRIKD